MYLPAFSAFRYIPPNIIFRMLRSTYRKYLFLYISTIIPFLGLAEPPPVTKRAVHFRKFVNSVTCRDVGTSPLLGNCQELLQKEVERPDRSNAWRRQITNQEAGNAAVESWSVSLGSCGIRFQTYTHTPFEWKLIQSCIKAIHRVCVVQYHISGCGCKFKESTGIKSVSIGDSSFLHHPRFSPPSSPGGQEAQPLLAGHSRDDESTSQPPSPPSGPAHQGTQAASPGRSSTGGTLAHPSPCTIAEIKRICRRCIPRRGSTSGATKDTYHAVCEGLTGICGVVGLASLIPFHVHTALIAGSIGMGLQLPKGIATYCGIQPEETVGQHTATGTRLNGVTVQPPGMEIEMVRVSSSPHPLRRRPNLSQDPPRKRVSAALNNRRTDVQRKEA